MDDQYINELIEKLDNTEIWRGNTERFKDYNEGIKALVALFTHHKKNNSQIFFIGNGGSAAIAIHMTADFMNNGGMHTCSLYDNAVITGTGNDYGYEYIFSKPMEFLVREDDLVVAVSSSGNSKNIINAIRVAKEKNAEVVTFTGFEENNQAKQFGDVNVYVPCVKYGIVESIHNLILQQIVDIIKERDGITF